jgi:DNA polymerase III subunit delta
MVIVLHGPDAYRRDRRLKVLREAFQQKYDPAGTSVTRIDGSESTADDLQCVTASAGLFAEKRFVILTNPFAMKADDQETFIEILPSVSEDTILCVVCDALPTKKSALKNALKKAKTVEEFTPLSVQDAGAFVDAELKQYDGVTIEPMARQLLAERLHGNTWQLALTLKTAGGGAGADGAADATGTKKLITVSITEEALGEASPENFFGLTDALGARNIGRTLELLQTHVADGAAIQLLLTIIGKHLMFLRVLAVNPSAKIPGVHPYVLKKTQQHAKNFSVEELNRTHDALVAIDEGIKNGTEPDPVSHIALVLSELQQ